MIADYFTFDEILMLDQARAAAGYPLLKDYFRAVMLKTSWRRLGLLKDVPDEALEEYIGKKARKVDGSQRKKA